MTEAKEWYSNKDLYEMMVDLSKRLEATNAEMAKTQTMIRDYNGLRERLDRCEQRLDRSEGKETGEDETRRIEWDKFGYIIGLAGVLVAIIALVVK